LPDSGFDFRQDFSGWVKLIRSTISCGGFHEKVLDFVLSIGMQPSTAEDAE
jgi:hypothetical protein